MGRLAATMAFLLAAANLPGSALFTLETVEVVGPPTFDRSLLLEVAGITPGTGSVFRIDAAAATRRLLRYPRVASARVQPRPPHRLVVEVTERRTVAAVPLRGAYALIDAHGTVVALVRDRPPLPLVSVRGYPPRTAIPGQVVPQPGLRPALRTLSYVPAALRAELAHLQVTRQQEFILYLRSGLEVRLGPLRGLRERLAEAPEVIRALEARGLQLEYIDLRLTDNAVIKPRPSSPASPPAGPRSATPRRP